MRCLELSVFSGTSSSTNLTENNSKEWVDLIFFSGKGLMVRMRKTMRLEEEPGTSGAGSSSGGPEITKHGILIQNTNKKW